MAEMLVVMFSAPSDSAVCHTRKRRHVLYRQAHARIGIGRIIDVWIEVEQSVAPLVARAAILVIAPGTDAAIGANDPWSREGIAVTIGDGGGSGDGHVYFSCFLLSANFC
jgi:hypothetical protein